MPIRTLLSASLLAGTLAASANLWALPREGTDAPSGRVEDADGRVLDTRTLRGKPTLIVYEDKDSAEQNKTLKKELARMAQGDRYKQTVALAAIADVSAYDFWPVKGFVKRAIREESKKAGTTIYCDWDGSFRASFRLTKNVSNVVLVGRSGRILFAGDGPLNPNERLRFFEILRAEVEGRR